MQKKRLFLVSLAIVCLLIPHHAGAVPILEETGFISGFEWEMFDFVADQTPLEYQVTLTDFEFPDPFKFLGVGIFSSTELIAGLLSPGTTKFNVDFGTQYFAIVAGLSDDKSGFGQFGLAVVAG